MERVTIEVAIESADDAIRAEAGGADRLYLCSGLDLGGLTPSVGALAEVRKVTKLPVWVAIRPRPGDFVYSEHECGQMARDIEVFREYKPDGFVFGVLDEEGRVNVAECRVLRYRTGFAPAAFPRAFDKTPDRRVALERLVQLGFRRVQTSGGELTADAGVREIAALIRLAAGRIEIMPAGGVRASNVEEIVKGSGCDQIHGSFPESVLEGKKRGRRGYALRKQTSQTEIASVRSRLDERAGAINVQPLASVK
ncbi:MAG TPA: copper homeostasis protein CutC [Gemmataceae bacterium]|nr:copper homeostasis protein CutC [Gemmataceae bacterium]